MEKKFCYELPSDPDRLLEELLINSIKDNNQKTAKLLKDEKISISSTYGNIELSIPYDYILFKELIDFTNRYQDD